MTFWINLDDFYHFFPFFLLNLLVIRIKAFCARPLTDALNVDIDIIDIDIVRIEAFCARPFTDFFVELILIFFSYIRIKAFCARPLTDAAKYQERERRQRALASSSMIVFFLQDWSRSLVD